MLASDPDSLPAQHNTSNHLPPPIPWQVRKGRQMRRSTTETERGETYICPRTTKIYDLGTPIPILFEPGALEAVERVRDALAAAHHALVLVVAERALVADAHQRRRPHVRIAHRTLAVTLIAEAADGDAGLLAAHY